MIENIHEIMLSIGTEVENDGFKLYLNQYRDLCRTATTPKIQKQYSLVAQLESIVSPITDLYPVLLHHYSVLMDDEIKYRKELKEAIDDELKKYKVVYFI